MGHSPAARPTVITRTVITRTVITRTVVTRAVLVAALVAALAAGGCGGGEPPSESTRNAGTSPGTSASSGPVPFSGMVDIGDGRGVYLECTGSGSPTVLFESGDESDTGQWRDVIPGLIRHTRACAYDRLGNGRSDPATGCRTMQHLRGDLETLLRVAKIEPPFVLVGTSGGGYLVAGYALAHREHVAGMVLADTMPAINIEAAPPELQAELKCTSPLNQERRDYAVVEHEAWDHRTEIGDFPLTVISNDYGTAATNADERNSVKGQAGWLVLSPRGRQVVVTSGHNVPENEPGLVVDEILKILRTARTT